jgi:hypothetical protein
MHDEDAAAESLAAGVFSEFINRPRSVTADERASGVAYQRDDIGDFTRLPAAGKIILSGSVKKSRGAKCL